MVEDGLLKQLEGVLQLFDLVAHLLIEDHLSVFEGVERLPGEPGVVLRAVNCAFPDDLEQLLVAPLLSVLLELRHIRTVILDSLIGLLSFLLSAHYSRYK